jgi:anti-sigma regulatory factor (Ser/Thr protein kinase)
MSQTVPTAEHKPDGRTRDEEPVDPAAEERPSRTDTSGTAATVPTSGHAFAVVSSDAELLAATLPYLDAGLRAGDVVVVAAIPETEALIRRDLGAAAGALRFDALVTLPAARPPDVVAACTRYAEEAAARGVHFRVLAEVQFGPDPQDWREGERFESVFNRLLGQGPGAAPVTGLCLYDTRRLPSAVVRCAVATHPHRVDVAGWSVNPGFRDPAEFVPSLPRPREPLEETAPVLVVRDASRLADLRHQLSAAIVATVRDPEQREDLRLAASEIAANAFRHGRRPVSARIWADARRLVCEITDSGTSFDDPFAGFVPAHGPDLSRGGMGLWLARKLFDHVDLIRRPRNFTVRLSTRLR